METRKLHFTRGSTLKVISLSGNVFHRSMKLCSYSYNKHRRCAEPYTPARIVQKSEPEMIGRNLYPAPPNKVYAFPIALRVQEGYNTQWAVYEEKKVVNNGGTDRSRR